MKIKSSHIVVALMLVALVVFLADDSVAQCSMCRKIANDGNNAKAAGAALNSGILYLLALPYFLVAFFFRKQIFGFMRALRIKK